MGGKGLKFAFWAKNSSFLADFAELGSGKSLCPKKLSEMGGYPIEDNHQYNFNRKTGCSNVGPPVNWPSKAPNLFKPF